jgi:hypothetical protein
LWNHVSLTWFLGLGEKKNETGSRQEKRQRPMDRMKTYITDGKVLKFHEEETNAVN